MKRIHDVNGHPVRLGGWKPPLPHAVPSERVMSVAPTPVPHVVNLRPNWFDVLDQGLLGYCFAHAFVEIMLFNYWKTSRVVPRLSRLFLGYVTRVLVEGQDPKEDGGASLHDTAIATAQFGVCPEELWAYDPGLFELRPPAECFPAAQLHQALSWRAVPNLTAIKTMLANWYPVAFGFTVYPSMMTDAVAASGVVPMPGAHEQPEGGHAVVAVGYDDTRRTVQCVNSWGKDWGDGGFFTLPYEYFEHGLASDAHVILREEF